MSTSYEAVIGLEVHCQLLTNSKAFSAESAGFVREPNTQIDFVSLGYPGTLPVLNQQVVAFAVKFGLATNCSIRHKSTLSRKHYFYPDLPKGYQISQYEDPICYDGLLQVADGRSGEPRPIRIKRIHLEEDAGKSIHDHNAAHSHLDYNRCGVPLLELVTEPDIRHPSEAHEFVTSIRQIVRYLGICDGNMDEGSLRCDANVSVRHVGESGLRTKSEIKNVNSMRHVEQALEFEIQRQIAVYEAGGTVEQETLLWNPEKSETKVMRSKEMAHDYRYFPDPDLPPVVVSAEVLTNMQASLPEMPHVRKARFVSAYQLSDYDASLLTEERAVADYFEQMLDGFESAVIHERAKQSANFLLTNVLGSLTNPGSNSEGGFAVSPRRLADLISMRMEGQLSSSAANDVYARLVTEDQDVAELATAMNLLQVSDESALDPMVDVVLAEHPTQVEQYLAGKLGLIGFLIGKVMQRSDGAADPTIVRKILENRLAERAEDQG